MWACVYVTRSATPKLKPLAEQQANICALTHCTYLIVVDPCCILTRPHTQLVTHMHTYKDIHKHAHTHTHSLSHTHTYIQIITLTHTPTHTHTHTHIYVLTALTHSHSHSLTYTHSYSLTLSRTHTTHTHTHTQLTLTHTHAVCYGLTPRQARGEDTQCIHILTLRHLLTHT